MTSRRSSRGLWWAESRFLQTRLQAAAALEAAPTRPCVHRPPGRSGMLGARLPGPPSASAQRAGTGCTQAGRTEGQQGPAAPPRTWFTWRSSAKALAGSAFWMKRQWREAGLPPKLPSSGKERAGCRAAPGGSLESCGQSPAKHPLSNPFLRKVTRGFFFF